MNRAVVSKTRSDEAGERKDRQFVTALKRGLEVLRCFENGERFLGNQDIAKRTGLPKPTVSRLTYTLTKLGYLNYSENFGKYQLGTGVLSLGSSLLANLDIRQIARPFMEEIANATQSSVALGVRDHLDMIYIENCRGRATFTLDLDVGSRIPIATTAMGRAYLCGLPEGERDYLMSHLRIRYEENWQKLKKGIEQAFKDYQDRGFCFSIEDWRKGVNAVGVPLAGKGALGGFAFNCCGPSFQLSPEMLEQDVGPRLATMVRNIEAAVGRV